jgi:hypothetical protein
MKSSGRLKHASSKAGKRHEVHRADSGRARAGRMRGSGKAATALSSSSVASSATTSTAAGIACGDIDGDLNTVVSDLKTEDAKLQEAWVSGGDSADLQALINDTNGAGGSDKLNTDAATFNSDASGYLSDNSPYLAPGWQTGNDQVTNDINALAKNCGQPTAPSNSPASP